MLQYYAKLWWVIALRGLLALIFGICAFFALSPHWPPRDYLRGIRRRRRVDGFADGNLRQRARGQRPLDPGAAGVAWPWGGALTWLSPAITALSLLIYIAAWTLATGVLQIVAAVRLRKEIPNEWWLILTGLVSIAFAFLVLWRPLAGALAVLWLIGSWAIVCGILLIGVALRLRSARPAMATHPA